MKQINVVFCNLLFTCGLIFLLVAYFFLNERNPDLQTIKGLGWMSGIYLSFFIYSWKSCTGSVFTGYTVFAVAFYAFNLGQTLLFALGIDMGYKDLLFGQSLPLSKSVYFVAAFLGILFMSFMHLGALLALAQKRTTIEKRGFTQLQANVKYRAIQKTAYTFLFLSLPFWLYYFYRTFSLSLMYGYDGLEQAILTTSSLVRIMKNFFEPSMLMLLLCSFYFNKNKWIPLTLLVVFSFLPPLIMGGRSQAVIIAALMLLVYALFNKIPVRKILYLLIAGYFFLIVLHVVGRTRHETGMTVKDYTEFLSSTEVNPAIATLAEMGWSMCPLGQTITIIPQNEDYRYGSTYFWALTSVIPNLGFWDIHPSETHSNMGKWLYNKLGLDFGPGFSIGAEAYANFGYFGFIFFILYGFILAKYSQYIRKDYISTKPIQIILTIIFLWFAIKTVRNAFQDTVRALFYVCVPIYLVYKQNLKKRYLLK